MLIADAEGPTSIAGVMGGARSEVRADDHARADGGRHLGRRQHPPHLARARPAQRGLGPLREGPRSPSRRSRPRPLATRLMIELCGATRARRARSTSAATRARRRATIRLRDARRHGLLGVEVPRDRCRPRSSTRSSSSRSDAADGLDVDRPAVPARRRHPRGRPDRGGRAARRARATCRRRCRRGTAPPGGSPTASACAARRPTRSPAPGLHEIVGWSFEGPELAAASAARPTRPAVDAATTRCRPTSRGCARRCSARCWMSPRRNRSRGAGALALFEAGAVYLTRATGEAARRAPPPRPRCSAAPVRPATWRDARAARGGLLRRQGRPRRRCSTRCACRWTVAAGRGPPPFLHPGRAARDRDRRRRRPAGSASCTRRSPPRWDLEDAGGRASSSTSMPCAEHAAAPPFTRRDELPRGPRGPGGGRRRRRTAPPRCSPSSGAAGGALLRRRGGLRRLPRPRAARRGQRLARAAAALPRRGPHAHRRGGRRPAPADRRARSAERLEGRVRDA